MPRPCLQNLLLCVIGFAPITLLADLDLDTNGRSDIWERVYNSALLNGNADDDRDGHTNAEEVLAGTNPRDAYSRLELSIGQMGANDVCLEWSSQPGKVYSLWTSSDMSPDSWVLQNIFNAFDYSMEAVMALDDGTFYYLEVGDVDTDGDGLNDWEEHHLGFDPLKPHTLNLPADDFTRATTAAAASNTLSISVVDAETSEAWPEPASFVIRRSGGFEALTVNMEIAGSALNGVDYASIPAQLEIPFGETAVSVDVIPLEDALSEGSESVVLTLQTSPGYAIDNASASVTISDTSGVPSAEEAARFLTQATFGPTDELIAEVQALGIEGWIDAQFAEPVGQHQPILDAIDWVAEGGGPYAHHKMRAWWANAMHAPDPLRQRIAMALSEILVISDNSALANTPRGMLNYYDMLLANAFGNYRELIEDVTFHPTMGVYLSHRGNQPPDPDQNRFPDENYAREIMQLFTIGLWMLNEDGTLQLDVNQEPIPTYNNADITNLARVFTGMSWAYGDTDNYWQFFWPQMPDGVDFDENYTLPMKLWNGPYTRWVETSPDVWEQREFYHHDQEAKTLLGVHLPANDPDNPDPDYPANDIDRALDVLFQHQNVGPFIGKLLIQRLVTSNPSPAYVSRVAAAFADNGNGVRGDMRAVIKAILLDPEARDYAQSNLATHGMLREPYLRLVALCRTFNAASSSGLYEIYWIEDDYGMQPLSSPSVFNFFQPYYQAPGQIKDLGLVSPEFQITNAITGITVPNHFYRSIMNRLNWHDDDTREVFFDFTDAIAEVSDVNALIRYLDLRMTYGQMSHTMRELLYISLTRPDIVNRSDEDKARLGIYLVAVSPEFSVMR